MRQAFLVMLLFGTTQLIAQTPVPNKQAFQPGEKLKYTVSYFMSSLWTDLAGLEMNIINVPGKEKPIYRLEFNASTFSSWDSYVKIRHSYQTWVDAASVKPLIMKQDSDVKGHTKKAKYSFKYKSKLAEIELESSDAPVKTKVTIADNTLDIVSLLYYLRNLDYDTYPVGKTFPISVLFLERVLNMKIKYLGKETIDVGKLGKKSCYKLALELERDFVVKRNSNFLWLTADNNRVPVLISAIFKEGEVKVKLTETNGLKN
ncbi:MAG TPA: hypothetical protein DCQ26_12520 [Marinilabiliales bacterium]|nr:MAG: hypothetical protein A2W95_17260 [Bacteroidetes bacterium GWA2_40_14]OFX76025.1 MAG: hypothetical protein A2W96_01070 [Bacteroidetes bacterium GWD2_40_43]OFX94361.1 MAG: hypothetical protein A2W97_19550 [Bacteroidetes bacterium GWE2_40_63]OFY18839.1 MAG: hypothetical protein A2W88_06315 [Bacteroidetes bacterium GWF2_40_13]OFZ24815.1 MAG: hypothetical protein A2437_15880 [Bacteroidetes bacterium RIFOXYC2_FULL_40_12]HAM99424.1 hypothetical protein [Marinilabiliales bacterium]